MSTEPLVFRQCNLVVSDMDAGVAFYRRLGLDIPDTDGEWARHHRSVALLDGVRLDFDSENFARQWERGRSGGMGVLGLSVATRGEVDRLYDDLTGAGDASQPAPYDAFWGARYAIVSDPDGNAIGLMSPIDPAQRSTPEAPR